MFKISCKWLIKVLLNCFPFCFQYRRISGSNWREAERRRTASLWICYSLHTQCSLLLFFLYNWLKKYSSSIRGVYRMQRCLAQHSSFSVQNSLFISEFNDNRMSKVVYVWCVISRGTVLKTCGVCNEKLWVSSIKNMGGSAVLGNFVL